ncbi:hypothetical protein [Methylococcus capsulatus]|uniref:hypothetical protein n=1 Tax=Methylococcus capsulatus TaxID=414 RepID=UPI001C52E70D|nr:hypothetical protein [Methylococcus capsulatus]QXP89530.1 hypothetical protein KW114_10460 [Methylococcus capsulatus]
MVRMLISILVAANLSGCAGQPVKPGRPMPAEYLGVAYLASGLLPYREREKLYQRLQKELPPPPRGEGGRESAPKLMRMAGFGPAIGASASLPMSPGAGIGLLAAGLLLGSNRNQPPVYWNRAWLPREVDGKALGSAAEAADAGRRRLLRGVREETARTGHEAQCLAGCDRPDGGRFLFRWDTAAGPLTIALFLDGAVRPVDPDALRDQTVGFPVAYEAEDWRILISEYPITVKKFMAGRGPLCDRLDDECFDKMTKHYGVRPEREPMALASRLTGLGDIVLLNAYNGGGEKRVFFNGYVYPVAGMTAVDFLGEKFQVSLPGAGAKNLAAPGPDR